MLKIAKTEFYKLKRYSVVWIGVATMLTVVLLTRFMATASDGAVHTLEYFSNSVIWNNFSLIFPATITLIAGYIIERERVDDTLKNILTIPIPFRKLLAGKLIAVGGLAIILAAIEFVFTMIIFFISRFPGFSFAGMILALVRMIIGGYIIDREYTQNTQKNLFTIPVRWSRVIKAKVLVAFSLSIWIGLFSNIVLILTGMVMNCSQIAITDIWKIVISNFISPVCVLVGTLPIILWFSKAKGKYLWGATLSLLLGVSGVFVANGRAVNWHPITYCFSFIQCDSIYTTVLKIPFSCLAIVLYLLLSVIIYVFMYRKQEYPVS